MAMLAAVAALAAASAHAVSVLPLDLGQLVANARDIAHVRCMGNTFEQDATVGVITVTTFVVFDRVKGDTTATIVVRQPGGELNGLAVDYHVPRFTAGAEYVVFVPQASRLGLASPVGFAQGVFDVQPSTDGARKEVTNGRDFSELLAGADRAQLPAGMAGRLTMSPGQRARADLGDFMTVLRNRVGAR
jgi:hypothetical protein